MHGYAYTGVSDGMECGRRLVWCIIFNFSPFYFWNIAYHYKWNSLIRIDRLAIKQQRLSWLCLSSTYYITSATPRHHTFLYRPQWWTQVLIQYMDWNVLPVLFQQFSPFYWRSSMFLLWIWLAMVPTQSYLFIFWAFSHLVCLLQSRRFLCLWGKWNICHVYKRGSTLFNKS